MNNAAFALFLAIVTLWGCSKKVEEPARPSGPKDNKAMSADPTKALYDSVMGIHDEVMPRMGEIIRLTESLKDKIAKTPDMPATKRQEIEAIIQSLDKASDGMMDWMHKFSPEKSATNSEEKRAYLKEEMVKIQGVKADMLTAIEKAKGIQ